MSSAVDDKKDLDTTVVQPLDNEHDALQKLSWKRKLLYHLWDNDQHLKSPEERALLRKLDAGILICESSGCKLC